MPNEKQEENNKNKERSFLASKETARPRRNAPPFLSAAKNT